jgi:D-3-phosphoglycerate dehydrogenase
MLVLVIDPMGGSVELEARVLAGRGHALEVLAAKGETRRKQLGEAAAILATEGVIDSALLDLMPKLRVAATYGVGYDNIDVAAAKARGVAVANVPDYCTAEVADHTLALILALLRGVVRGDAMVHDGAWSIEPFAGLRRIRGRSLGLIGLGRIGRAVAERAGPFGFIVRAADPWVRGSLPPGVALCSLDELLPASDVVSIHAPLTPETRGIVSADAIRTTRPGAVLVNTSRGGLLDLDAALEALDAGRLGGLALDVFPEEPVDPAVFAGRENVVLTPHVAFYSREAMNEGRISAAETVADVLDGKEVTNRVA